MGEAPVGGLCVVLRIVELVKIALATGRAYLMVYAQKLVIEVDERARDTAKKHYDYAHKRYAGGVGTSTSQGSANVWITKMAPGS